MYATNNWDNIALYFTCRIMAAEIVLFLSITDHIFSKVSNSLLSQAL
jgi:hypothetical protein